MIHTGDRYINPLTDSAEIAKFDANELRSYEQSVNAYRDIKNGMDAAKEEGIELGRKEGSEEGQKEIARNLKQWVC